MNLRVLVVVLEDFVCLLRVVGFCLALFVSPHLLDQLPFVFLCLLEDLL